GPPPPQGEPERPPELRSERSRPPPPARRCRRPCGGWPASSASPPSARGPTSRSWPCRGSPRSGPPCAAGSPPGRPWPRRSRVTRHGRAGRAGPVRRRTPPLWSSVVCPPGGCCLQFRLAGAVDGRPASGRDALHRPAHDQLDDLGERGVEAVGGDDRNVALQRQRLHVTLDLADVV